MDYTLIQSKTWPLWWWLMLFSLLTGIAYLPFLGYLPLHFEEPRRALIAANMLHSGDYVVPIHAGRIYLGKPPLFNWLIAIFSLPFNTVSTWSARLPSVISLWFITLFLVSTAWRHLNKRVAIFWGCALLLSPEILIKGRMAEVDIVFMCLVTAALWNWWLLDQTGQRGLKLWLIPLLLTTLAYLTKREPAFIFFYLTIIPYLLLHRRGMELLSFTHCGALLLSLLPIVIGLIILSMRVGWIALWNSILHEVLLRGANTSWTQYWIHVVTYPLQILLICLPFSLLLLPLKNSELRYSIVSRHTKALQFATIAVLVNLPVYWLKGSVAVRYFLPMFPFLLLLAALGYDALQSSPKFNNQRWLYMLLPGLIVCMLFLRSIEFLVYLPIKHKHLANTQNAPAIIADIKQQLPLHRPLFVSDRIPSAIWLYAPLNLLHLWNTNSVLIKNDLILRHAALSIPNVSYITIHTYRYGDDIMLLEKVELGTGSVQYYSTLQNILKPQKR